MTNFYGFKTINFYAKLEKITNKFDEKSFYNQARKLEFSINNEPELEKIIGPRFNLYDYNKFLAPFKEGDLVSIQLRVFENKDREGFCYTMGLI